MSDLTCIGCGGVAYAGSARHQIAVTPTDDVCWHADCHAASSPGCEICAAIVAAHPDLKDQALGAKVFERSEAGDHPAKAVLERLAAESAELVTQEV